MLSTRRNSRTYCLLSVRVGGQISAPICRIINKAQVGMTVSQFKSALEDEIREVIALNPDSNLRMLYFVSNNGSNLIERWYESESIVEDSGSFCITITSINTSGNGYGKLLFTSYATAPLWAQIMNGKIS